MRTLVVQDPFFGMHNLLGEVLRQSAPIAERNGTAPRAEMVESEEAIRLAVELPGVKREDVKVEVENGVLSIRAEKHAPSDVDKRAVHLSERLYGSLERRFRLPRTVNADRIEAQYADGLLTIELPKSETARRRTIDVLPALVAEHVAA